MIGILLAGIGAAGLVAMIDWGEAYRYRLADFITYVEAGRHALSGEPIYAAFQEQPYHLVEAAFGQGFVYPPPAAALFIPLQWVPSIAWRLLNLLAVTAITLLIVRRERGPSPLASLAIVAGILWFPPTWSAWANGQVTPLLAAGFGAAWLWPRALGPVAGIGAMVKLFPAVLVAWAIHRRAWHQLAAGVAIAVALGLATALVWPGAWESFVIATRNGAPGCSIVDVNSLRCVLTPVLGAGGALVAAVAATAIVVAMAMAVDSRHVMFALLGAAAILPAGDLNWPYWLVPAMAALPGALWLLSRRSPHEAVEDLEAREQVPGGPGLRADQFIAHIGGVIHQLRRLVALGMMRVGRTRIQR